MAKGRYSPDGLISRQTELQLHDSRLIVAIPSQGGVRIPDEDENGNILASRSQICSMYKYDITRISSSFPSFGLLYRFPLAIRKPHGY